MSKLTNDLQHLSSAEEFFDYFSVPYERAVLNVSRLHILKRFHQYLSQVGDIDALPAVSAFVTCRDLLARAHDDFVDSSGIEQKVFPVFRSVQGEHRISIEGLKRNPA